MEATEKPEGAEASAGLKLCQLGQEVSVSTGARIVSQGEAPEFFYVIQSGRVRVFRETADRIQTNLTELGAGAYFGEVALVTGQARSASVEALEDAKLIKVSKEEFDRLLDQNPQLARHIIQQLASWLVAGDRRVEAEVVHQVKLRQVSWFDYVLMMGLSLVLSLVVNIYNDNRIPLIHGWGEKNAIPEITPNQALEMYQKNQAIFVDARKSAFYSQEHIKDATNLPEILFDLMFPMFQFILDPDGGGQGQNPGGLRRDLQSAHGPRSGPPAEEQGFGTRGGAQRLLGLDQGLSRPRESGRGAWHPAPGVAGILEWMPVSIFLLILIPPIRRSPYLSVFCRVLLAAIFISFALSKIMRPAVFALNVVDYNLTPAWGVNLWSLALPWGELVAGLFLLLGIRTRAAATLIAAMNVIFIVGLVNAILHHMPINCGCVGEVGEPVNWLKVMKNTGMLVMCIQIFLYDRFLVLDRGGFILRDRKI